ncbi:cilia- and flagella-associated protein 20-like [Anopheles bellator]|uniref:cilia- and flagella-associated protein 20-like n=1 Tax=Anopheles bellator TaxID=139047 RepID=UPI002647E592|nr:cilia- and flagella-associated protein 20-like [Anopheles bellator]
MFRHSFQHRFVTVYSSAGSKPLAIWDVHTKNGHTRRLTDEDLNSLVFELIGVNVATTYMVAPCAPCPSLSIKLPFLVMLLKNLKKFFSFEITILDDRQSLRRLRFSNYQSETRLHCFGVTMPLSLEPNWHDVRLNLADFTRRLYGTNYVEAVRLQIHANVRIKCIYFSDQLYTNEETPAHLRLMRPIKPCRVHHPRTKMGKIPDEPIEMVRPPSPELRREPENITTEPEAARPPTPEVTPPTPEAAAPRETVETAETVREI